MNATERKRRWRLEHPEQSREYERRRAQARRRGHWGETIVSLTPQRPCASADSYYRYERTIKRVLQKMNWRRLGPGTTRMRPEELRAAYNALYVSQVHALGVDGTESSAELIDNFVAASTA
jgi:hypothetical protein